MLCNNNSQSSFSKEGNCNDAGMLRRSGLLQQYEEHSNTADGQPLCICGDPAYPQRQHLQCPYKHNNMTEDEESFNKVMSKARVSVEWVFGEIASYFAFVDFTENQKISLSKVGTMYKVYVILTNARTCLYGSATNDAFKLNLPSLEEYFQQIQQR